MMSLPLLWCGAQDADYAPLAEDGKVWHMEWFVDPELENLNYEFDYFIDGDTVIAGQTCKKVYTRNQYNMGDVAYSCALLEEGRKVSLIEEGQETARLIFDFNVTAGNSYSDSYGYNFSVREVRLVNMHGIYRHAYCIVHEFGPDYPTWWIEGIGSTKGPTDANIEQLVGDMRDFKSCEVNGQVVCDQSDLAKLYEPQPIVNCDVNGDGVVDIDDVNIVINAILN